MKHVGDITKLNGAELEPVDVVTGGSPCQNLSIAGNRKGLAGEQSALFFEQIRVIREMREADAKRGRSGQFVRPRFCVWENVPGALSSNGGRDFQKVLSEFVRVKEPDAPDVPMPQRWPMAGCLYGDGWSLAWRVHDAQFWGVPQRRKRIALVVDFGGRAAPEVLFEPHRLSWDSAAGGEAREKAAGGAGSGTAEAGGLTNRGSATGYIAETLRANPHGSYPMVANALTRRFDGSPQPDKGTGNVVATYRVCSERSYGMQSDNPFAGFPQVDVSNTIDASDQRPEKSQGGIAVVQGIFVNKGGANMVDVASTVTTESVYPNKRNATLVYDARGNVGG